MTPQGLQEWLNTDTEPFLQKIAPLSAHSNNQSLLGRETSPLGWEADLVREGVCVWLHRNCCCGQRELLELQTGAVASFHFGVGFLLFSLLDAGTPL